MDATESQNFSAQILEHVLNTQKAVKKAGGLFYQYRPCRRDDFTVYDIENIRHRVVYAQTPLNMNDPFDSNIGFSEDKLYDELIDLVLNVFDASDEIKSIIGFVVKFDLLSEFTQLITALNNLKKQISVMKKSMRKEHLSYYDFFRSFHAQIYAKLPKMLRCIFPKPVFQQFGLLVGKLEEVEITEENINEILGSKEKFDVVKQQIIEIRDTKYIPLFKQFLSKINVSCFSVSGWDNALMWSHYANSYSGICVEYDFSDVSQITTILKPVKYSKKRPTIALKDFGVASIVKTEQGEYQFVRRDFNIINIIDYLCIKDTVWEYEKEWRFICPVSEPNKPNFIEIPKIKSITFGVNVDPLCKQLLLDVCNEGNIECYELKLGESDFKIGRVKIDSSKEMFDSNNMANYMLLLANDIEIKVKKCNEMLDKIRRMQSAEDFDAETAMYANQYMIDYISDAYYWKLGVNRLLLKYPDITNTFDIGKLQEQAKGTDERVREMREYCLSIGVSLVGLLCNTNTTLSDMKKIGHQLTRMKALTDRYAEMHWLMSF